MDNRDLAREPEDLAQFFSARANAGDVEGLVALYEADAVLAAGERPIATGHEEIRRFFSDLLTRKSEFPSGEQSPALRNGELAMTMTRLENGNLSVEVARRQADGSWRWVIDQLKIKARPPE